MERSTITITRSGVKITLADDGIWLSQSEIAQLFDVFVSKISSNIRSVLESGVLDHSDMCRYHEHPNGKITELYNLEMIAALAFRIDSPNAKIFRKWLITKTASQNADIKMNVLAFTDNCRAVN